MRNRRAPQESAVWPDRPRLAPRRRERRWLGPILVLVAMIVLADALIGEQSLASSLRARKQFAQVDADIAALRNQNARLRDEIRRLREDPGAIEYTARKDLGLARPGEIVVLIK
jgi:cell division protein FtsB